MINNCIDFINMYQYKKSSFPRRRESIAPQGHIENKYNKIYNIYMKSGGYVYILASSPMGTLYIGSTSDLVGRIWQHKNKIIKGFTSKYCADILVYYEWHDSLRDMVARERQLKKWNRNWKIKLIIQQNPDWKDLYNKVLIENGYN